MILRRLVYLTPLLLLVFVTTVSASVVDEIARDFKPLSGFVIMPVEGEFLIDKDAGQGVAVGDLFSVVKPGEKVVHPVTKKVLGSLDEVKGILQVIRVKEGYSYARPVRESKGIVRGDAVRRFENVTAAFWDYQGSGEELYRGLKGALPQLEWQGYHRVEGERFPDDSTPLVFSLRGGKLEVLGPEGKILRTYSMEEKELVPVAPPSAVIIAQPSLPAVSAIVQAQSSAVKGIWMSPELNGEVVGVAVAELDGDGLLEIAVAYSYRLEIGRIVDSHYQKITSLDLGYGQKVVSLDSADLDGNGVAELYLTAADQGELRSLAVVLGDGQLVVTHKNLPWYFRSVRFPGEPEALFGQAMGRLDDDFDGPFFRIENQGGKLFPGARLTVPKGIDLYGFAAFTAPPGEVLYAQINFLDNLKVVKSTGEVVWQSDQRFGGGEAFIERKDPSKNPADGPATRNAFLQKRLEFGPDDELLIPINEGSRLLRRGRNFDRSLIKAMVWNGFALQERWSTQPQEAYLADFCLADADNDGKKELVQALVFTRQGFNTKPRSALTIFELP